MDSYASVNLECQGKENSPRRSRRRWRRQSKRTPILCHSAHSHSAQRLQWCLAHILYLPGKKAWSPATLPQWHSCRQNKSISQDHHSCHSYQWWTWFVCSFCLCSIFLSLSAICAQNCIHWMGKRIQHKENEYRFTHHFLGLCQLNHWEPNTPLLAWPQAVIWLAWLENRPWTKGSQVWFVQRETENSRKFGVKIGEAVKFDSILSCLVHLSPSFSY